MERRLAAILVADVVGFSRLIEASEEETVKTLTAFQSEALGPLVTRYKGRIVKFMGDGALIEFASAVNAVLCAVELQSVARIRASGAPAERQLNLRIGINLADVLVESADLYGDGVNIAARLQALAEPGGIIVSQAVFSHVRDKVPHDFDDLGEQQLKNIAVPVRIYKIVEYRPAIPVGKSIIVRNNVVTVAVLAFRNLSGDPEQDYFSEGITEDIITDLSKVSMISVVSRNTAFSFKINQTNFRQLASQLHIAFAVEGSVRKSRGRVRISAQLIDLATDTHTWAERFDRDLDDIFFLQDEISSAIVAALKVKVLPQEKKAIEQRSTFDANAYELYLLGRHYMMRRSARDIEIALRFARRALELDAAYARAWSLVALGESSLFLRARSASNGLQAAQQALALDDSLAEAHAAMGRILAEAGQFEAAAAHHEQSLQLDPSSFDVQHNYGLTCLERGMHEKAIYHLERAAELLEGDVVSLSMVAVAYEALGDRAEFASAAQRALDRVVKEMAIRPDNASAIVHGVLALARLGENDRAHSWAIRAMIIEPDDVMDKFNIACAMAYMGDHLQALDLLEQCAPRMPPDFVLWIKQDEDLKPLHRLPRYQTLIAEGEARLAAASAGPLS